VRWRVKTSFLEEGPDFDIVGTCEWLSYVSAPGLKRMACWLVSSSHSMFGVLLVDSRSWIWICSGL
jgi:hypothetical protein